MVAALQAGGVCCRVCNDDSAVGSAVMTFVQARKATAIDDVMRENIA